MKQKLFSFVVFLTLVLSFLPGLSQAQVDSTGVTPLLGDVRLAASSSCEAGFVLSGDACVSIASISSGDHFTLHNGVQTVGQYVLTVSNLTPTTADIQYEVAPAWQVHRGKGNSVYHASSVYHIQVGSPQIFNEKLAIAYRHGNAWSGIHDKSEIINFDGFTFDNVSITAGNIADLRNDVNLIEGIALNTAIHNIPCGGVLFYKGVTYSSILSCGGN